MDTQTSQPKSESASTSEHDDQENARRAFLKQLGKYSIVASATTVTLMTSRRSAASLGGPGEMGGGPP